MRSKALVIAALVGFAFLSASSIARAQPATFTLPDAGELAVTASGGDVRVRVVPHGQTTGGQAVAVDAPLARLLRGAAEIYPVGGRAVSQSDRIYLVLAMAAPSVAGRGGGYCGAGTEDFLLLVEWMAPPRKLALRDQLRIQSCLNPMELRSDRGNELRTVLSGVADPARMTLVWLQHPQYGAATKTVTIVAGKFAIAP